MNIATMVLVVVLVGLMGLLSGCQTDLNLGSISSKLLFKGENKGQEHLSRNAGMTSQTGYGYRWTVGNFGKEEK